MANESILIIEDDNDIRELIRHHLTREGYRASDATTGPDGLARAKAESPDLILLDLMLPGISGLEICKLLKGDQKTALTPIIMVTAKGSESDIVHGLEMGADDYVVKPFSLRLLVARVKAVLRRHSGTDARREGDLIKVGDLEIHLGRHEVRVSRKPVELTLSEFQILKLLAGKPGWVFTRYQIVDNVKGDDYPVTDRSVDVQIVGLRKKLGKLGDLIETVRGVGYRFADPAYSGEE
jgi:two-component system phosphate regulon response regulator PhoB